ncbi:uncharacterized protein LOC131675044 [Phymastichus coffea]|uniref:uncharacterized protein LOC131675044 n=1 Tax=Phymastichus coffea TaxID=108790 RepID=UPI00273BCA5F|nr:uncharacterized protein LOC131675044 [Phymastichus coffea]
MRFPFAAALFLFAASSWSMRFPFAAAMVIERLESDHLPLYFELGYEKDGQEIPEEESRVNEEEKIFRWKNDRKEEYIEEMEEGADAKLGMSTAEKWKKLIDKMEAVSKKLGMCKNKGKQRKSGKETCNKIYDGEYKLQRKIVWKCLKRYLVEKGETEKGRLKEERNKLKWIIKEKWREQQRTSGEKWKLAGRGDFWKALAAFRPRRTRRGEGIKKSEWIRHFKPEEKLEEEVIYRNGEEEMKWKGARDTFEGARKEGASEKEEPKDSLNRDITRKEVADTIGKLKDNKPAGEDGITGEFFKNLPEKGIDTLTDILSELWREGEIIEGWKKVRIFPIYKAGDESRAERYHYWTLDIK